VGADAPSGVLGEEAILYCTATVYPGTAVEPAEGCDNLAEPGEDTCVDHLDPHDPDAEFERAREERVFA
jgi:hypothetical protein